MAKRIKKPVKIDPFFNIGDAVFIAEGVDLRCGKIYAIHDRSLNDYVYAVQFEDSEYLSDIRFYEHGSLYRDIDECMNAISYRIDQRTKAYERQMLDNLMKAANKYNYVSRVLRAGEEARKEAQEIWNRMKEHYEKRFDK